METYYKLHQLPAGWVFQLFEVYHGTRHYGMTSQPFTERADAEAAAQNCGYLPEPEGGREEAEQ